MPVWQVLGGGGAATAFAPTTRAAGRATAAAAGHVGYGTVDARRKYEDLIAFMERPGELPQELLSEGFTGMKLWPFDYVALSRRRVGNVAVLSVACSTPTSARSAATTSLRPT